MCSQVNQLKRLRNLTNEIVTEFEITMWRPGPCGLIVPPPLVHANLPLNLMVPLKLQQKATNTIIISCIFCFSLLTPYSFYQKKKTNKHQIHYWACSSVPTYSLCKLYWDLVSFSFSKYAKVATFFELVMPIWL